MKKLLVLFVALFGMMNVKAEVKLPDKTDHEVVKMYLVYGNSCGYCHRFIQYFVDNYKNEYKDYFEIAALETWQNNSNANFAEKIRSELGIDRASVPLIVIGKEYQVGFATEDGESLIQKALDAYASDSYSDFVGGMIKKSKETVTVETLKQAASTAGLSTEPAVTPSSKKEKNKELSTPVLIGVLAVVVLGGVAGLVVIIKKQ
ncbi:MAG: hypothetical protein K2M17_04490 [Bacilli bacterium]|nr:hypothetical protein [Bacilli bacterium]